MNIAESTGESSCKGRENGDASSEFERPLKKARFAWQVKGKYHLKNELPDTAKSSAAESPEADRVSKPLESEGSRGPEQNLETLDYLLKQDFTLDSVIVDSDQSLLKPSTSISNEKLTYPRYVSSSENKHSDNVPNGIRGGDKSMSLVDTFAEDICIAQWQERQMAKGFVDNTINRVLESWIHVPLPAEENNTRYLALDVAEFINNLPGDNSIENEGILMAISAHGLQNTSSSNSNNASNVENSVSSEGTTDISSPLRSLSPLISEDETQEPESSNQECDADESRNNLNTDLWSCNNQRNDANDIASFSLFPEASSLSYQLYDENHQNSNSQQCNENSDNHYDFLDTAVLFAIQSKGLTTFGTDYG